MESDRAPKIIRHTKALAPMSVAEEGTRLVSAITQYLSTIPTPVDILEDLASIVAVTSALLTSLEGTMMQYRLSSTAGLPFVQPLCSDISTAFEELRVNFEEARREKAFELNEKGLVRTARFAWFEVVGGGRKAVALRSRLCVEKYRVRVLIDTARFKGLSILKERDALQPDEMEQLEEIRKLLPIIVERLAGVHSDYLPRIQKTSTEDGHAAMPVMEGKQNDDLAIPDLKDDIEELKHSDMRKLGRSSTESTASSITVVDDSIEEAWLLRRNESENDVKTKRYLFGIQIGTTYQYKASSFYVKPIPATTTEIRNLRQSAVGGLSQAQHEAEFKKAILGMDDKAQWEIQKLLESRDKASSSDTIKRNWEVVAFEPRARRKISEPAEQKWWKKGKSPLMEWVLILKGETVDHQKRTTPVKHENPWAQKKEVKKRSNSALPASGKTADVLTHVEKRNFISMEEAEKRMESMIRDLFTPGQISVGVTE